jgi:probable phosphoglycerate mutase
MTRVILVRHGETEWNRVERFRGWADVPLNETGLAQAEATGRRVADEWQPVAIYSSPLSRALKTAAAIAQHFDLPVQAHQGLIDIHHGQWQGLTPDEVRARWPELLQAWHDAPHTVRLPDGETLSEVRARGLAVVHEVAERHAGETVVLVGHTDINRAILLGVLGLNNLRFWHLRQDTCAINVFEVEQNDFTLVSLNETYHLRLNA